MKYNNKEEIKETAIKLYIEGKKMTEIAKITGCSRNFIGNLIREDERIKQYKNKKIVNVYKRINQTRINVPISTDYWEKIGISKDCNIKEYVEITVDEDSKTIIINKV